LQILLLLLLLFIYYKVHGDLPELHFRLSQHKLERMARMSVCLNAAIEASAAVAAAKKHAAALRQHTTAATTTGGTTGDGSSTAVMPSQSSLATFLDFQRSLSQRFDALKLQQPQVTVT
jgi:hypothetical protein